MTQKPTSLSGSWQDYVRAVASFRDVRVLVVGDVMVDVYVQGTVDRISPEGPVPVLSRKCEHRALGGAANVAANIAALGGTCSLLSVVGHDPGHRMLTALLERVPRISSVLHPSDGWKTPVKTRFVANGQQLLRVDDEAVGGVSPDVERVLTADLGDLVHEHDLVVLSDYAKGVLSDRLIMTAIGFARAAGIPVVVDPKRSDLSAYAGATVLTPNTAELEAATGLTVAGDRTALLAAGVASREAGGAAVLVTRGAEGMTLMVPGGERKHIRNGPREVFDVVGAGDTVVASLALAMAAGLPLDRAAELASLAAGIAVARHGTVAVSDKELLDKLSREETPGNSANTFTSADDLVAYVRTRAQGGRVGFTNGVFDLLHPGHLASLREARSHCDFLVVGINSDSSVKRLKGQERPINTQLDRAQLLTGMSVVDAVCIFEEDTPYALLAVLRPDVFVKGADYSLNQLVGRELVESYGGEVVLAPLVPGQSSTNILTRVRRSVASTVG